MRAFGCSAKSRKLIAVGSPDELPKITIVPFASTRAIAAASEAPPAASRIRPNRPSALSMPSTICVGAAHMPAALEAEPTTAVTCAPDRAAICTAICPTPPGRAGDQHPLAEQRRAVAQCAQRRQPGDRQGRRLFEADVVRQCRHPVGRRRDALRPAGIVGQRDDPGPGFGAAAVGRLMQDHAADVLTRPPALGPDLHQPQFAAVQRKGAHLDHRLVRCRGRLGHLAQLDRRRAVRAC